MARTMTLEEANRIAQKRIAELEQLCSTQTSLLDEMREERTKLIAYAYIRIDPTGWEDDPMQEIISAEGEAALEQGEE